MIVLVDFRLPATEDGKDGKLVLIIKVWLAQVCANRLSDLGRYIGNKNERVK